ncbi:GNAT family N-acetyltransferase [Devosia rhizoryzae]|uniref:GNAT family N-acetyltransferase n=1 Tax=Devosia rhizoryzae TaxID=2774137 RepID=A0ABX7C791_9HYPH|nr:GNAT family N-acetyltransferase [Devosia rhizoryzae]QQR40128.1 GNAT family N-acetyltransferase [Devosia rhizoryzae]
MSSPIRMRKVLDRLEPVPPAPHGISLLPFSRSDSLSLHALLQQGYATGGGSVGKFESWFEPLISDEEFDPDLVLIAVDEQDRPLGLAQCWTSGFLKDLVVLPEYRDRQIGTWLLHTAFAAIRARGLAQLDLKVLADNVAARRFYARHGMVEVE